MALDLVPLLTDALVRAAEQAPEPEDVKAGWLAFGIFIALAVAVGLLGWSLTHRLRNAQSSEDAGRYDPSDRRPRSEEPQARAEEMRRESPGAPESPGSPGPSTD
ncbi:MULTISPECIES: hypothetical protein [unclassified Nocardioides]|uniref:hypothetical protein n=1 Tax=unclassified Nocardioides TaxID=2615069 RepID=UPI002665C797|nr:hypothetical protein [Nocardioides sp. Arc9.136]WKN49451.1 hypothetical protein OSR43_04805 [Nocardioides sp. Arc9.136]